MKDEDLIYLFTGTSEIFIKNRMNRIIQSFNKYEYTIIKYDMETTSLSTVLSDAITVPFLEELKIIILKNPKFLTKSATSTKDEIKAMLKYLKSPCDSTLLIIDATNTVINQSNEIYKMLKNVARIIDYPDPEEIELKGWIVRSFDANGIDIKDDALTLLLEYIVKNLVRLMRNSRDDTYKQYIINKKGVLSLFLHIIYGFVIMFPMYGTLYFLAYHHLIINLFALPEVPAIEPITAGFVFIFYDGIAVLIKNLIIKGIKKYKFYKQEKKAQAIISAANIKKEEEDNDEC